MTSKERVRNALAHQPVDRVPLDYEADEVVTARLLKDHDFQDIEQLLEYYKVDIRWFKPWPAYTGKELVKTMHSDGKSYYLDDVLGYKRFYYWNGVSHNWQEATTPLAGDITLEDVENHDWPDPNKFCYDEVKSFCEEHPDKAIAIGRNGFFQRAASLRGFEQLLEDFYEEPELAHAIIDHLADIEAEIYERMLIAGEGKVDFLRVCDDYGTQISLLIGPNMWNEYFSKHLKRFAEICHRHNAYFMLHSCGAVRPLISEIIKCGVDALDPIQKVAGMEPQGLKDDFGDSITFHGGIDTQGILPNGTPEEVYEETKKFVSILNRNNTGYILTSSQSLEPDVSTANIDAMFQAGGEL